MTHVNIRYNGEVSSGDLTPDTKVEDLRFSSGGSGYFGSYDQPYRKLTARQLGSLEELGVTVVGEFGLITRQQLLDSKGFGVDSVDRIEKMMKRIHLYFAKIPEKKTLLVQVEGDIVELVTEIAKGTGQSAAKILGDAVSYSPSIANDLREHVKAVRMRKALDMEMEGKQMIEKAKALLQEIEG